MNYYVLIEGQLGAKAVFERWINYVNRDLKVIQNVNDFDKNNYFIVCGGGYPSYFKMIENGILDVNDLEKVETLVLIVDSEEMSYQQKLEEMREFLSSFTCRVPISIVIQNFCFETWALGNKKISNSPNTSEKIKIYKSIFDVNTHDPEKLPGYQDLNRAKFAYLYLKELINSKHRNLTYTKKNTQTLWNFKYYYQIEKRCHGGDIKSFKGFLETFSQ